MRTRIAPIEPPYEPDVAHDFARLMPPGMEPLILFRTLAQNPRVLRRVRRGGLLDPGSIGVRERELVILRTTARCGSEYEWGVHVRVFGAAAGFTEDELVATVHGREDDPAFGPRERSLIALADALHDRADVSDVLWAELEGTFRPDQLIELVVLAGLYHAVSFVTRAARLPLEGFAPRFPPPRDQPPSSGAAP